MLVNIYVKITQKAESMEETNEVAPFIECRTGPILGQFQSEEFYPRFFTVYGS